MILSLENWVSLKKLQREPASKNETADLLKNVDEFLTDSKSTTVSNNTRFNTAYNAALLLAKVALRACGYRTAGSGAHHFDLIWSLHETIGTPSDFSEKFQKFSKKRHQSSYDAIPVSDKELKGMIELAEDLYRRVRKWLKANHPELLEV